MADLKADVLEIIESARLLLTNDDVLDAAKIWPLNKSGKLRAKLKQREVDNVLAELIVDGKIQFVDGGFRLRREVATEDTQLQLF